MKKFFSVVMIVMLMLVFTGCGSTPAKTVSNNIVKSTEKLSTLINNLDGLSTEDIDIQDISPISSKQEINTLNNSKSNQTVSKKISLNNKKNTTYSANKLTRKYNLSLQLLDATNPRNSKVKIKRVASNDSEMDNENPIPKYNEDIDENFLIDENNENQENLDNNDNKDNFYSPKYKNDISDSFSTYNLDEYYNKLKNLYTKCADCISTQAEYNNCLNGCKNSINSCQNLAKLLKDGKIVLSDEELDECNKLLENVNNGIKLIQNTKGDLKKLIENIKPLIKNYNLNIDDCSNCYDSILNCLDKRIENLKQCEKSLNEVIDVLSNGVQNDNATTKNVNMKKYTTNRDNTTIQDKIRYKKLTEKNSETNNNQSVKPRIIKNIRRIDKNKSYKDVTNHRGYENENDQNFYNNYMNKNNNQNANNANLNNNTNNQNLNNQNFNNSNPSVQQARNAVMNGQGNGFNNGFNGAYNGGNMNYFNNGYSARNVDSYAFFPRNTDTYQKIYTNIDTYSKNYVNQRNMQNNNAQNNEEFNEEFVGDDYDITTLENNSQDNNVSLSDAVYRTSDKNFANNNSIFKSNKSIEKSQSVSINKKPEAVKDISAPIPSPYDPSKMDEINEKMRNKESGELENENEINNNQELTQDKRVSAS